MKKLLTLFCFLAVINSGCKKDPGSESIELDVNISYVDSNNADLLDPLNENGIKEEDIDIFYLEHGEKKAVYNGNLDYPENFLISKSPVDGKYFFRIFVNATPGDENITTTYIDIKNRAVDTLKAVVTRSGQRTQVRRVWYNSELKWDGNGFPGFNITK